LKSKSGQQVQLTLPSAYRLPFDGFLLGLFFDPEDRGDIFLQTVG
jgi:hypothetical protein